MVEPLSSEAIERAQKNFAPPKESKPLSTRPTSNFKRLDVPTYLNKYGIEVVKTKSNSSSILHCLKRCVFDESHANNEAAIGQTIEGKLFYQCFHNSCKGKTWHEARQIISGDDPLFEREYQTPTTNKNLEEEIRTIADLDRLQREVERNRISKEYGIRKSVIDRFIEDLNKQEKIGGTAEVVTEVEPFEEEVDGVILLNSISHELSKYVILPDGAREPIAAWTVLTYCSDAFRILPMLGVTSPVKRCGKTTLLEVLQGLTNKGLTASNISPAAVFRTIDKYHPTLLIDEADTFLKDNDELRGVLNSGHTKTTAFVIRVEGENHEPVKFSTWGPKAISMICSIGTMPDTLQDRSVVIQLRRKAPGENACKLDIDFEAECLDIRRKCQRWVDDNLDELFITRPHMPNTNNDRMTDNWMPLFAIAEVAGGDWPELIKKSMLKMMDVSDDSVGPMLLEDIRDIFNSNLSERIFSDDLVEALKDRSERPWCDWNRGKGLTQNGLARLLKPFDVKSKTIRIEDKQRKGYALEDFKDAFKRYISSFSPSSPFSSVPPYQSNDISKLGKKQSVPHEIDGTDEKQYNQLNLNDWYAGTDEKGGSGKNKEKETISSATKRDKFSKENKKFTMEI